MSAVPFEAFREADDCLEEVNLLLANLRSRIAGSGPRKEELFAKLTEWRACAVEFALACGEKSLARSVSNSDDVVIEMHKIVREIKDLKREIELGFASEGWQS